MVKEKEESIYFSNIFYFLHTTQQNNLLSKQSDGRTINSIKIFMFRYNKTFVIRYMAYGMEKRKKKLEGVDWSAESHHVFNVSIFGAKMLLYNNP